MPIKKTRLTKTGKHNRKASNKLAGKNLLILRKLAGKEKTAKETSGTFSELARNILREKNLYLRIQLIHKARVQKDRSVLPIIIEILKDSKQNAVMRQACVWFLGEVTSPKARTLLRIVAREEDEFMAKDAIRALRKHKK